jgi:Ran GTPase-activating protein (RanGAP) involved in mRNA processing and transport
VEALAQGLEGNGNLTSLNLDNVIMGDEGLTCLARALKKNAALQALCVRYNRFDARGARALEQALLCNATLASLDVSCVRVGSSGGEALGRVLAVSDSLRVLRMARCGVCEGLAKQGIHIIAKALRDNHTLTELDLRGNHVNNFGATQLARALARNTTLLALDLANNPMLEEWHYPDHAVVTETDDRGIPSITTSLERNLRMARASSSSSGSSSSSSSSGSKQQQRGKAVRFAEETEVLVSGG